MTRIRGVPKRAQARVAREERVMVDSLAKAPKPGRKFVADSYQNFAARVGVGTNNLAAGGTYGFNPVTRMRTLLEWAYRGSWLVGQAVDCIPEDMTKRGVAFLGEQKPAVNEKLTKALTRFQFWNRLCETLQWSRLYGGALLVMFIKDQDPATPLRAETVGRKGLQNLVVLDRWMVDPSLEDLVTDPASPDLGKPKYYDVTADACALPRMRIHHTRVFRFEGIGLPYNQRIAENLWGLSVIERIYDRLTAFDSATTGAAQLLYRADVRTYSVPKLRDIIAAGGPAFEALIQQIHHNELWQSNERMFVIDGEDKFERHNYSFAGIPDTILQFAIQVSGALQIPMVRLFGQSPGGLNSTGESDFRNYYDGINQRQERDIRPKLYAFFHVLAKSEGLTLGEDFDFNFNPLWILDDKERVEVADKATAVIIATEEAGIVKKSTALRELQRLAPLTGMWSNITDEDVLDAEEEEANPPEPIEGEDDPPILGGTGGEGDDPKGVVTKGQNGDPITEKPTVVRLPLRK